MNKNFHKANTDNDNKLSPALKKNSSKNAIDTPAELADATKQAAHQDQDEDCAEKLIVVNKKLAVQNNKKENLAAELLIANKDLIYQIKEKEKRAAELIIANRELAFQNKEKEKRAAELVIANKELAFQNMKKEKCAEDLIIANKELAFQNYEKEKRAEELIFAIEKLKKAEEHQKEYTETLEKMMFITSHKLRHPIANIVGILNHVENLVNASPEELEEMKGYMRQSVASLDNLTRELTSVIYTEEMKLKNR